MHGVLLRLRQAGRAGAAIATNALSVLLLLHSLPSSTALSFLLHGSLCLH
jgi:Mg2+/Co2+ transporter CorB